MSAAKRNWAIGPIVVIPRRADCRGHSSGQRRERLDEGRNIALSTPMRSMPQQHWPELKTRRPRFSTASIGVGADA